MRFADIELQARNDHPQLQARFLKVRSRSEEGVPAEHTVSRFVRGPQLLSALLQKVDNTAGNLAALHQQLTAGEAAATPTPATRGQLLVAEDNAVNQKLVRRLLEKLNCSVDIVGNGREAVEAVAARRYDLVFMDCQMPEMDGFTATRTIREAEGDQQHTTIIAMTAHAMAGDRERCIDAGMDDYMSKPINPQLLESVVKQWLKAGRSTPVS
jgi:CheY-like chemotaxis protein